MAPNKDKIRASAQKHLQKGQIDGAIKDFQRLVELDPKDVRTLLKVGDLQTRAGKHKEATETYGQVAQFYSDQGFFLKAVAVYKQILKIDPTLIDTNLKLAELYHQLGLISDASNQYRQISQMYEKLGRIEESIDVLRRMVELDPENIASRIKLAEVYAKQGMVEEARNEFRAAAIFLTTHHRIDDYIKVAERIIHYDPSDLETTRELANIYVQKGDARRALAKLQICFKANPKDAETLGLLANAFRELGQVQKTISVFRELAHLYRDRGDNASYVGAMQKILDLAPDDSEARAAMSSAATAAAAPAMPRPAAVTTSPAPEPVELEATEIEVDEEEIELADDALVTEEVAAAPAPERAAEAVLRILTEVDVYVKYGLKNKALEHVQKVFELDANNLEAHRRRKELLVEAGETRTAVAELWWLARAAHSEGDADQLQADLEELLSLEPGHREATQLLAQLGLAPPAAEPMTEEIEVEIEPDIDLGEEELVAGATTSLDYEPAPAAAEIDLDEGYTETSDEIAAALDDEPFDLDEGLAESAVVSGESTIRQSRQRPSEVMGAHAHGVSTAETSSVSGSSAVNLAPSESREPRAAGAAAAGPQATRASSTMVDLDELDELLASAPRRPGPPPVVQAVPPATADEPILREPIQERAGLELVDEVEEIEFFLQQGLEDEARDSVHALLLGHPDHPELLRLNAELDAAVQAEPEPEPVPVDDGIPEPETVEVETLDLAAELAQELDAAAEDEDFQVSFADVFDEFKRGVAEQVDDSDHQTHYDLGIAYKEMGLLDDAVREFGLAVKASVGQIGALTMIGICHLELGRTNDALEHFLQGLNSESVTAEEALALRFEIGRAYESMGKLGDATKFYEKVHAMDASFRDVATRLENVKNASGNSTAVTDELDALLTETAAEKTARGKISYV